MVAAWRRFCPAARRPGRPRHEVIGEYLAEGAIAPIVMIRRGPYKFVHSPVDPDQLYDLSADPLECTASRAVPSRSLSWLRSATEVAKRWSLAAVHAQVLASQRHRHLVDAALRVGRYVPWDYQPRRDASRMYVRNDQALDDIEALARFPPPGARP